MKVLSWMLVGLLLVASILYGCLWNFHALGAFADDVSYILAAQSLMQGRYVVLQLPWTPALNDLLPGFPAFLVPFAWLFAPHWDLLRLAGIAATLLSGVCLWFLSENLLSTRARGMVTALFLLNPLVASYAPTVMSDPFFVCLTLLAFYLLKVYWHGQKRALWILSAVLFWASIARPHGILLFLAVLYPFLQEKKVKASLFIASFVVIPWAAILGRNVLLTGSSMGYWRPLLAGLDSVHEAPFRLLIERMGIVSQLLIVEGLGGGLPVVGTKALALVSMVGVLGLLFGSFRRIRTSPWLQAIPVFIVFYLGVHFLWQGAQVRYMLPLIPLLIFLIAVMGATYGGIRLWRCGFLMGGLMVGLYAIQDVRQVQTSWKTQGNGLFPTYSWVQNLSTPDAFFLAANSSTFYLRTGRWAAGAIQVRDANDFYYWLQERRFTHVLVAPVSLVVGYERWFWEQVPLWIKDRPARFSLVFDDDDEKTKIYEIKRTVKYE